MKTTNVTVEETHYQNPQYPFNVWLEGRWFHLDTKDAPVELGDEITVQYDPQGTVAVIVEQKQEPSPSDVMAEKIYQVLHGQRFSDWYGDNGDFGMHVRGDFRPGTSVIPSKDEIMKEIKRMFRL
jgi:hypothetical protein